MTREVYFAGGCFWGVEHFFKGVSGVVSATPGYANGNGVSPSYKEVYTDTTGFAETVKVVYDPETVSLRELVRLFFAIIDPLSLNKQGHDEGTRYRSGVYYIEPDDFPVLRECFMDVASALGSEPVTELLPLRCFYPAEEYHQDYLGKNPDGYCHLPLKAFRYLRLYQDLKLLLGDEPDTVARMANTAALLYERMHFFWVGFYRVDGRELVLGPFQGPSACQRITYGKGVCGKAWESARTIVVPDVEEFPGHIACNSLSKSEIVVPVFQAGDKGACTVGAAGAVSPADVCIAAGVRSGAVRAVLDIDSTEKASFDSIDAAFLELVAQVVLRHQ